MSHPAELADRSSFDAQLHLRLVFGSGSLNRLGELAADHGAGKVLLVTDPGIRAVGHVDRALTSLNEANLSVVIYDQAKENPTTECVMECAELARQEISYPTK